MQHFEQDDRHRMTDEEAQEVIRLLAERRQQREELESMPSVQDVAQIAGASSEDVLQALEQVRRQSPPVIETAQRKRAPIPVLLIACAFFVLLLAGVALVVPTTKEVSLAPPAPVHAVDVSPVPEVAGTPAPPPATPN